MIDHPQGFDELMAGFPFVVRLVGLRHAAFEQFGSQIDHGIGVAGGQQGGQALRHGRIIRGEAFAVPMVSPAGFPAGAPDFLADGGDQMGQLIFVRFLVARELQFEFGNDVAAFQQHVHQLGFGQPGQMLPDNVVGGQVAPGKRGLFILVQFVAIGQFVEPFVVFRGQRRRPLPLEAIEKAKDGGHGMLAGGTVRTGTGG